MITIVTLSLILLWLAAAIAIGEQQHRRQQLETTIARLRLDLSELHLTYHRHMTDAVNHIRKLEEQQYADIDTMLDNLPRGYDGPDVMNFHRITPPAIASRLINNPIPFELAATLIQFRRVDIVFEGVRRPCWVRNHWLLVPWSKS